MHNGDCRRHSFCGEFTPEDYPLAMIQHADEDVPVIAERYHKDFTEDKWRPATDAEYQRYLDHYATQEVDTDD